MLICITGMKGCGKSTQVRLLHNRLGPLDCASVTSKAVSEETKRQLEPRIRHWDPMAIAFLYQGFYVQQCVEVRQALAAGKVVIADRWDDAFYTYPMLYEALQKYSGFWHAMHELAFGTLLPDVGFFLDVPKDVVEQRLQQRGRTLTLEKRFIQSFSSIRNAYLQTAKQRKWQVIDGTLPVDEIATIIFKKLFPAIQKT